MKYAIILTVILSSIFAAEPIPPQILLEDQFSPFKAVNKDDGKGVEYRTFSFENDKVRIVVKKGIGDKNDVTYSIVIDGENECYSAEIKDGKIAGNGDKEIDCRIIKDNTRYYPFTAPAYLIYSKKYGFVFPIIDKKEHYLEFSNDMIMYFMKKYLKQNV